MNPDNQRLQFVIDSLLPTGESLRVLEAGCGSTSHLKLDPCWHLTGIDLSEHQLAKNKHLHERVLGNLETYCWDADCFDMIVCWDVIEHLPNPQQALRKLFSALAPGGLVVLAFPNLLSLKGMVTKFTPHLVHLAFYRYMIGDKRAFSDLDQFPTYLRRDVLPHRIVAFGQSHDLELCFYHAYEGPVQRYLRSRNRLADIFFAILGKLGRKVSGGRLDVNLTDCMVVLRRPSQGSNS